LWGCPCASSIGGGGLPVAWTVLPANQLRAWRREWWPLLRRVRPAIPPDWRGWGWPTGGCGRMVRLGWHPLLRGNNGAKLRPVGQTRWDWRHEVGGAVGQSWRGRGTAFVSPARRVDCTLVAWWSDGDTAPWLLLTDLAPEGCDAAWYRLRSWCEQGGQCCKRGGAVAIDANERPRAGGTSLVGPGGRHTGDGQRRRGAGSRTTACGHGGARSATAVGDDGDKTPRTARSPADAPGLAVVCGLSAHPGRLAPAPASSP
jgi:hypothetical protein